VATLLDQPAGQRVHVKEVGEIPESVEGLQLILAGRDAAVEMAGGQLRDRVRRGRADQVDVQVGFGQGLQVVVREVRLIGHRTPPGSGSLGSFRQLRVWG
jgi:hypothetical protein